MNKILEIYYVIKKSFLGSTLVAKSEKGICAIFAGNNPEELIDHLYSRFPEVRIVKGDKEFEQDITKVIDFIEMPTLNFDMPLDIRGTAFQQQVWQALTEIRVGTTASYSDIAKRIGSPKSVRAVAQACAANAIAVVIPCHRVVRRDGTLSGYRWGVERKRMLLEREHAKCIGN